MLSLSWVGAAVLVVIALAAAGGAASSGTTRLGREIGFLGGLFVGLVVAVLLQPHLRGPVAAVAWLLGVTFGGGLLGAAVLGGVGHAIARGLYRVRLGALDRLLGAVLSGVGALIACVLILHLLVLFDRGGSVTRSARHDAVAHWLIHNPTVVWF